MKALLQGWAASCHNPNMEIRIKTAKGTGKDGWPCDIYILVDRKDERLNLNWWYTRAEAEAERLRLLGKKSSLS